MFIEYIRNSYQDWKEQINQDMTEIGGEKEGSGRYELEWWNGKGWAKEFRTLRTRTITGKNEFCEMRGSKA